MRACHRALAMLLIALALLATTVSPALAYVADGQRYVNNVNYCYYGSGIPSAWKDSGALANARAAWNNAGSKFRIYYAASAPSYMYGANRGTSAAVAVARHIVHPSAHNPKLHSAATIEFNTSFSWSTTGATGKLDAQNVATHEVGHWVFLGDLYGSSDTEKTMYGQTRQGETKKRSLASDDINGIKHVYP